MRSSFNLSAAALKYKQLTLFFLAVVLFTLRPGGRKAAERAAEIPLKED